MQKRFIAEQELLTDSYRPDFRVGVGRGDSTFYRADSRHRNPPPDYLLTQVNDWLVSPYEPTGISAADLERQPARIVPLADDLKPDWQ